MQATRAAGVGAFVLIGVALAAAVLFLIGDRRGLFSDNLTVYTELRGLSGVDVGTPVWVAGMRAGEVKGIQVPSRPGAPFRLRLQVSASLHPIVRTDSIVSVRTEGLVGGRYLQIAAGTEGAPRLPDGGTLQSQEPFDVAEMLGQVRAAIDTFNTTIVALRGRFDEAIGSVQEAANEATGLIRDVSDDVAAITVAGRKVADDASELVARVRAGQGTMGKLLQDDKLYKDISQIASEARQTAENIRAVSQQARATMDSLQSKTSGVQPIGMALQDTLEQTRTAMANLADATEALKHNFLLRGYFRQRGYFNLQDISAAEYRGGVLEREGRAALRIWLSAPLAFQGPDAEPAISAEGRQRLDSAIGQFLQYRDAGPLMVEGYSVGPDQATRYLISRARAAAVRDYLIDRFDLDPSAVGFIGLGDRPVGEPPADPWDGIALAVFVPRERQGR